MPAPKTTIFDIMQMNRHERRAVAKLNGIKFKIPSINNLPKNTKETMVKKTVYEKGVLDI